VAMTSDVAGFMVWNVSAGRAGPCVRSVVTIAVHHRSGQRKFAVTENTGART
jgi:hypothetical protein